MIPLVGQVANPVRVAGMRADLFTCTTPGVNRQVTWTVPGDIQANGGLLFIDAAGAGGGGGGGHTVNTGGGGGGGGAGDAFVMMPIWLPPGTLSLFLQIGGGGAGGAAGAAGLIGGETYARLTSHAGVDLFVLGRGFGGAAGGAANGGDGGASGGFSFGGGGGGATGNGNQPGGPGNVHVPLNGAYLRGSPGGGGAGNTGTNGGAGGFGPFGGRSGGTGNGAGGGGGYGFWFTRGNSVYQPTLFAANGSFALGGNGGGTPTAGATSQIETFGAGGGGGGRTQAGGAGGDGFIRIWY